MLRLYCKTDAKHSLLREKQQQQQACKLPSSHNPGHAFDAMHLVHDSAQANTRVPVKAPHQMQRHKACVRAGCCEHCGIRRAAEQGSRMRGGPGSMSAKPHLMLRMQLETGTGAGVHCVRAKCTSKLF